MKYQSDTQEGVSLYTIVRQVHGVLNFFLILDNVFLLISDLTRANGH